MDDQRKASVFLDKFYNVYTSPSTADIFIPQFPPDTFNKMIYHITDSQIFETLSKLPKKNNYCPDQLPFIFLRKCALTLASPIALIIRKSLFLGKIPTRWKQAIVLPIPKNKKDNTIIDNYRPVSITCSIVKITEKLVCHEISSFIDSKLKNFQHGFRPHKSTSTCLLECMEDWSRALEQRMLISYSLTYTKPSIV